MKQEIIPIQNLKCQGCVNSIAQTLGRFPEITDIKISLEDSTVTILTEAENKRLDYEGALTTAGYPPAGVANPIHRKAQSYVSCAIGRVTK